MRIELAPELLEKSRHRNGIQKPIPRMPASLPGDVEFQQLLHNIYDAVLITDMAGEIVMANVRANQFFLAEPGQLTSYNLLALVCGAEPALLATIQQTLESNRFVLLQAHCVRIDASVFPAEISVNRLRLSGKQYLSFFVRDITLRKQQEESLRTGHTALQNARSAIVITCLDGQIEYFNPAFLPFVGLDEDVQGRRIGEFLYETGLSDQLLAIIRSGKTWSGELQMRRADGMLLLAQASVAANTNAEGEAAGMVLSLLDITGQKRAQQQLEAYAAELNRRNAQMQEDLNIASELHQALFPLDFELFPRGASESEARLRFSHLYRPSGTIGGDFLDLRQVSEHEATLFIADVMGHGIRSALVVATLRGLLEELRATQNDPGQLLTQLNATYSSIFKRLGGDVIFATAFYAVVDTRTWVMRYANASHPLPYLLRRQQASIQKLQSAAPSAALGLFEKSVFVTGALDMAPGDLLLLYTDGLSEAENSSRDAYETARFEQQLQSNLKLPAAELLAFITEDARQFSDSGIFADDVCLLAMERLR